jgi:hypothetical protein
MEIRSADESNAILSKKLDMLAANNVIPKESLTAIKDASKESANEGKTKVDAAKVAAWVDDKKFYRGVLIILGSAVIITTLGGLALAFSNPSVEIPQFIVAIGTTALGAIAGLLAPSPTH